MVKQKKVSILVVKKKKTEETEKVKRGNKTQTLLLK